MGTTHEYPVGILRVAISKPVTLIRISSPNVTNFA